MENDVSIRKAENRKRLKEIMDVMRRHDIVRGITPDKLCAIIEDLGPTFIKLGQILSMRADFLPRQYCDALKKLQSGVAPMPMEQVRRIIKRSYGRDLEEVFSSFDETALGSASIAQAHAAVLQSGEDVVIKVQREGIRDTMSRDITLLKEACKLLKYTPVSGLVDFTRVLDEMWLVAQQEMNFITEADNLEKFHDLNQDVVFVTSPQLYREYTTTQVLVMERIDGLPISDLDALKEQGYDPAEIGEKLADNYVKQFMTDGFFHADPHPGNLRVRGGQIVWLDMGMMGTLDERTRALIGKAVEGIAQGSTRECLNAVLGIGEFRGKVDKQALERDLGDLLSRYTAMDLGSMDLAEVFNDMREVMQRHGIAMPASLTMLARGLSTLEGVVADLSPNINVMQIAAARISGSWLDGFDWRKTLPRDAATVYRSARKSLEIPAVLADALQAATKGELSFGEEHRLNEDTKAFVGRMVSRLSAALLAAALLVAGGLMREAEPAAGGVSVYSMILFAAALGVVVFEFLIKGRKKR